MSLIHSNAFAPPDNKSIHRCRSFVHRAAFSSPLKDVPHGTGSTETLAHHFEDLCNRLNVPRRLRDVGVEDGMSVELGEAATRFSPCNDSLGIPIIMSHSLVENKYKIMKAH